MLRAAWLSLLLTLVPPPAAWPDTRAAPLFLSSEPLDMELSLNLRALCRRPDRRGCEDVMGRVSWSGPDGSVSTLDVRVRPRSGWRLNKLKCNLPLLFLIFDEQQVEGTLFEGQFLLPMTTHCKSHRDSFQEYVLREYAAYRLYRLFSTRSLNARLLRVTYLDTSRNRTLGPAHAFFTEHFEAMAARNGSEPVRIDWVDPYGLDPLESTTLALFQYMIGNTDWSIVQPQNTVYIKSAAGRLSPVPFDFDFSGLVNARYAGPPPGLPIRTVRQRLYRGFCYPDLDWGERYRYFLDRQAEVFRTLREIAPYSRDSAEQPLDYISGFYDTLASQEERSRRIEQSCR